MEREENGIIMLVLKLTEKAQKFEKQIKSIRKINTADVMFLLEMSDHIDKMKLHIKNKTWDNNKASKVYSYLISKDIELVNLARTILSYV
jgi:hypothetical protein